MLQNLILRHEKKEDMLEVNALLEQASQGHHANAYTNDINVNQLRKSGLLGLSIVAEMDDKIVGHIAFSKIQKKDGELQDWYFLASLVFLSESPCQILGKQLIKSGLSGIKKLGGKGCLCVGDVAYYGRFDFSQQHALAVEGIPKDYVLVQDFFHQKPKGQIQLDMVS